MKRGLEIERKFWWKQACSCSCSQLCQPCRVTPRASTKGWCRLHSPVTHTLLSRGSHSWYLLTAMFSHFLNSHILMDLFTSFLFCKLRCLRSCCPVALLHPLCTTWAELFSAPLSFSSLRHCAFYTLRILLHLCSSFYNLSIYCVHSDLVISHTA